MNTTKLSISKTAKMVTYGNPTKAKIVILALHGYGQLVEYFIRKFHGLNEDEIYVVAPEGIHRFYLVGTSGRVGASWMTKEERQDDIADNMDYINQVYDNFIVPYNFEKFVVLGFSQGAATAARWVEQTNEPVDAYVQWAGVFPPDLNLSVSTAKFQKLKHFYVVGNQDPYFTNNDNEKTQQTWLRDYGLVPVCKKFEGAHHLDSACIQEILREL